MSGDIFDELVNTDEVLDQFFVFLDKRMPDDCFQLISGNQRIISSGNTPDLTAQVRNRLAGMVERKKGFVHFRLQDGLVVHATYIEELKAVLVLFPPDEARGAYMKYAGADFVLSLIELFLTQIALDDKKEELKVQKKQFKRENNILQQRYYKLQEEAYRQQLDYAQTLNDEIDSQTKKIRMANERLQQEIEERKRMVVMANELALKAKMADRTKSEFLSRMSHEFRTPLNSIIGFSDMLSETRLDAEQWECLNFIKTSSHSLLDLINDILDLSKIEAGRLCIENVEFDLVETIQQVEDITRFQMFEKGIKLKKSIDSRLDCKVIGDPLRLRQVLVNLVGNAIKFMEKGDISIFIEVEGEGDSHIEVRFSVEDEGIGIPEDKIDTIFSPFTQIESSSTRKFDGSGLGLAISSELVNLMGGDRIFLKSEVGTGSTFFFLINFQRGARLESPAEASLVCGGFEKSNTYKILLVEDILQNRILVTKALTRHGHVIAVAKNGRQAVDSVQKEKVDVVLMDVQMPIMNGLEATRIIRNKNSDVPIIAMTAGAMENDKEKCLEAGMDDYISKPINIKVLEQKIERVIERKKCFNGAINSDGKRQLVTTNQELSVESGNKLVEKDISAPFAGLNTEEALGRLDNNEELYKETLIEFSISNDDTIFEIRDALNNKDVGLAERLAHSLKGTAGCISANVLRNWAFELEIAIRQKAQDRVDYLIDNVEIALNQALASVRAVIRDLDKRKPLKERCDRTGGAISDGTIFKRRLNGFVSMFYELEKSLGECDPDRSEKILASIKEHVYGSDFYEEILFIENKVNDFDFEEASKKLDSLTEGLEFT